jgi:O-antigen biosynthesis protein
VKICLITANYPPETLGGTEQVVVALAREFRERGDEVVAISGSDQLHQGVDASEEVYEGVAVSRLFKKSDEQDIHGFERPRIVAWIRDRLATDRPDVVHVHSMSGLGLGIGQACKDLGIPVVLTFHDLWSTCARFFRVPQGGVTCPSGSDRTACIACINSSLNAEPEFVAKALSDRNALVRSEVATASVLIAPSQTTARMVRDGLPFSGGVEVIPHGLLRDIPEQHRAAAAVEGEPIRVGTFGGLVPEKGLTELVEACVSVRELGLSCELHVSGRFYDEAFAQDLRGLAQAGGLPLVERERYSAVDRHPARDLHLAVFPSKCQESYGLVVDEALAHGVPAVVSDYGAFSERSATPGLIVTSHEGLAKVLGELVGSPSRLADLRNAIPSLLPSIKRSAQHHLDLYRTL